MGFFAFGDLKKNNSCQNGSESFSGGSTSEEIEKALQEEGMFFCNHYKCRMQEKHCVSYQVKSIEGFKPGNKNLYRPCCFNCDQGKQISAKLLTVLPKKEIQQKMQLVRQGSAVFRILSVRVQAGAIFVQVCFVFHSI